MAPVFQSYGQAGAATINNFTSCDMEVTLYSQEFGPCMEFLAPTVCIAPGGFAVIPPPGPPTAQWSLMEALPWEPSGCTIPCPPGILNVSSPIGCAPNPVTTQEDCGCNGGFITAFWTSPSTADLN